jgi:hypothetical protein
VHIAQAVFASAASLAVSLYRGLLLAYTSHTVLDSFSKSSPETPFLTAFLTAFSIFFAAYFAFLSAI